MVARDHLLAWLLMPIFCRKESRRPRGQDGQKEEGDKDVLGRRVVTGAHEALRDVRLCETMILDHSTDAYFRALGQENPAHAEKACPFTPWIPPNAFHPVSPACPT